LNYIKLIETRIKEAMAKGEFDNLSGRGKPFDKTDQFIFHKRKRLPFSFLKNKGFLPEEIKLKKEIDSLKEKIKNCKNKKTKTELQKELSQELLKYDLIIESYNRKRKTFLTNIFDVLKRK
jgi:hypothetical protein